VVLTEKKKDSAKREAREGNCEEGAGQQNRQRGGPERDPGLFGREEKKQETGQNRSPLKGKNCKKEPKNGKEQSAATRVVVPPERKAK